MNNHHVGKADDTSDRSDIPEKNEIKLFVERRIDRARRVDQEKRVAVRRRAHDRFCSDIATSTWLVFNYQSLTESFRKPWPHEARDDVRCAAGRRGGNDAYRECPMSNVIQVEPSPARID